MKSLEQSTDMKRWLNPRKAFTKRSFPTFLEHECINCSSSWMLHQVWYWLQGSANASYLKKASGGFGKHGLRIQATFSCMCRRKKQLIKYFWRHSLLGIQKMSPNCLRSPRSWMSPPLKCKCGWFTRQGANIFFSSVSRAPKGRTSKGWIWEGEDFSGRKTKGIYLTAK